MWGILQTKLKTMVKLSQQKAMKQHSIPIYPYADTIATEGTKPGCCCLVTREALLMLKMLMHQMLLSHITSGESIG